MTATVQGILLPPGDHASRPTSGLEYGTLYPCTTHGKVEQTSDDGATWVDWYDPATAFGTASTLDFDTDGTLAANSDAKIATQKATKTYVDAAVIGLLDFKGATDASSNPNYPAASKGDAYVVSVAGKVGGASGVSVDAGDVYVATADNAGGTQAGVGTSWFVLEHNLAGVYVVGGTDVAVTDGGTGASTASGARTNLGLVIGTDVRAQGSGDPTRASLGLDTTDSPQFTAVNVGHASDTTLARSAAGRLTIEGKEIVVQDMTVESPAQWTANTDNFAVGATTDVLRVSTDASRNLTGIVAPTITKRLYLVNVGAQNLVLKHDATSTAANRIYCPNDTDLTLQKDSAVELEYDLTTARWRVVGGTGSGGGSALTVEEVDGSPTDAAITKIVFPNDSVSIAAGVATVRQVPYGFIGCSVIGSTNQTLTTDVETPIDFDGTEVFDTDGFHSPVSNPSRITIPAGMGGYYFITAMAAFATDTNGLRYARIYKNGSAITEFAGYGFVDANGLYHDSAPIAGVVKLNAGDYIQIAATQGAGHNVATSGFESWAQVWKLDAGRVGSGVGVQATKSGTQTITTETAITFGAENFDTDGFHDNSSNTERLTVPAGLGGLYLVTLYAYATGIAATTNYLHFRLWKNGIGGTTISGDRHARSADDNTIITVTGVVQLAAGDYVVGSAASDDASFAVDGTGTIISMVRIDSKAVGDVGKGTAFPSGPATNDHFIRTDLGNMEFYYDGTRWLSVELFKCEASFFARSIASNTTGSNAPFFQSGFGTYLVDLRGSTYVATTNNGSNYWSCLLVKFSDDSTIASFNTSADSAGTTVEHVASINAVTTEKAAYFVANKTGSPGGTYPMIFVTYRLIAT